MQAAVVQAAAVYALARCLTPTPTGRDFLPPTRFYVLPPHRVRFLTPYRVRCLTSPQGAMSYPSTGRCLTLHREMPYPPQGEEMSYHAVLPAAWGGVSRHTGQRHLVTALGVRGRSTVYNRQTASRGCK